MNFNVHETKNGRLAELKSQEILRDIDDFLDLIGNANYLDSDKIIIHQHHLEEDFFHLKNRKAGEILQKFSTYNQKLAIIGAFSDIKSKSLNDFIRESNNTGRIIFVESINEAIQRLKG